MSKTFLFFGLGNPGKKYEKTFHNIGFQVLDQLFSQENQGSSWIEDKKNNCLIAKLKKNDYQIILAKPLSFMNLSGIPFKKTLNFFKIDSSKALIIQDDADLPLGEIRFSFANGTGGHKGIQSIFQEIGHQNLHRLRIGIGKPLMGKTLKNFVLEKISENDQKKLASILKKIILSLFSFCENGPEKTASLFNKKRLNKDI